MIEFTSFERRPFVVEAALITDDNIEELAPMVGTFELDDKGAKSIKVDRKRVPTIRRCWVGWYITRMGDQLRCFEPTIFEEQFRPHQPVG
jgi:hypothetical protein